MTNRERINKLIAAYCNAAAGGWALPAELEQRLAEVHAGAVIGLTPEDCVEAAAETAARLVLERNNINIHGACARGATCGRNAYTALFEFAGACEALAAWSAAEAALEANEGPDPAGFGFHGGTPLAVPPGATAVVRTRRAGGLAMILRTWEPGEQIPVVHHQDYFKNAPGAAHKVLDGRDAGDGVWAVQDLFGYWELVQQDGDPINKNNHPGLAGAAVVGVGPAGVRLEHRDGSVWDYSLEEVPVEVK